MADQTPTPFGIKRVNRLNGTCGGREGHKAQPDSGGKVPGVSRGRPQPLKSCLDAVEEVGIHATDPVDPGIKPCRGPIGRRGDHSHPVAVCDVPIDQAHALGEVCK
jgi:hypothetical protein